MSACIQSSGTIFEASIFTKAKSCFGWTVVGLMLARVLPVDRKHKEELYVLYDIIIIHMLVLISCSSPPAMLAR